MKEKIKTIGQITGKFVLLLTIWIFSIVVADSLSESIEKLGMPSSIFLFEFFPFIGIFLGHILLIRFFEKSSLSFINLTKDHLLFQISTGILYGLVWLLLAVIPIFFIGKGKWTGYYSLSFIQLAIYFFSLFLNAAMQELLVHGYLFSLLQKNYSKITALIVTSALFLLLHPGVIDFGIIASVNVFGAGLIFGLICICFDSLLATIIAHTIWNYFGAVWFGLIPLDNYPTMKLITTTGNPLLIGDKNGMETSIVVTVTIIVLLSSMLINKGRLKKYLPTLK